MIRTKQPIPRGPGNRFLEVIWHKSYQEDAREGATFYQPPDRPAGQPRPGTTASPRQG